MIEAYPSKGSHNRTRDHEKETDCAFREVELPLETSRALASHAHDIGSTPLEVGNRLFARWAQRNAEQLSALENVDEGHAWGEWRLPRDTDSGGTGQGETPETIHQTLIFTYDSLLGIVSYAVANQMPPAKVTSDIIVEELQEVSSTLR
ncbi:MAG: hypothetical protein WD887_01045 [Candidatus Saccharimonadales bacterium]